MFLAIACIVASLGILAASDNQLVTSWTTEPSTYLAIFTAIANLSMRYAAIQGVVLVWWTRALRGSTLSKLHWDWRSGTTLVGALTAGRYMGLLGLACILSTIVAVDGPLLQKSSTVKEGPVPADALSLHVSMAQEVPRGFTGSWMTSKQAGVAGVTRPWDLFNDTIPTPHGTVRNNIWLGSSNQLAYNLTAPWYDTAPISGAVRGCPGECKTTLRAPALFPTVCKVNLLPMTYTGVFNLSQVLDGVIAPPLASVAFAIQTTLTFEHGNEVINLITAYAEPKGCGGTLNLTVCTLKSGIGDYVVSIKDDKIQMADLSNPTFVALANNTGVLRTNPYAVPPAKNSTLGGVASMMENEWQTWAIFGQNSNGGGIDNVNYNDAYRRYVTTRADCPICGTNCPSFRNPQQDVIASISS